MIDDPNITSTQKKAAAVAVIVMTGFFVQDPYLEILPSLFTTKLMADATIDKYYGRT